MPEISHPRSGIPVQGPAFRFVHSTFGVHRDTKGGELMAIHKDLRHLQHTQELVNNVSAARLAGELREIRAGAQTRLQFCRLPVRTSDLIRSD